MTDNRRKLSHKLLEKVDNNPIFSVLQNPQVLEISSIRFFWEGGKINAQTEGLIECLFQKQLRQLIYSLAIP